jgi:hypothetical protein
MSKASLTKIEVKANKSGKTTFALMKEVDHWGKDCGYGVWKLCENYAPNVPGGIKKSWRYVERNMTLENAQALFKKKTK